MIQILLVFSENLKFIQELKKSINAQFGHEVIIRHNAADAVSMIEILPDVSIVICAQEFGAKICEALIKNYDESSNHIHAIILGKKRTPYPEAHSMAQNASSKLIIQKVGQLLGVEQVEEIVAVEEVIKSDKQVVEDKDETKEFIIKIEEPVVQYKAIHREYFKFIADTVITFNVYSRLKKKDSCEYTVKIPADSELSDVENERLLLRNTAKEFFVLEQDYEKARELLHNCFMQAYYEPDIVVDRQYRFTSIFFELIMDAFKTPVIDKYVMDIIKKVTESIESMSKEYTALDDFLAYSGKDKLFYGFVHSYFSYLIITKNIENFHVWDKSDERKLSYLTIFHDMGLHNEKLLKLHHHLDQDRSGLTEDELSIIRDHAHYVAEILETKMSAPKDLTSLVREHHGMRNGKGQAEVLSLSISPISTAFIVIEEFVTMYLKLDEQNKNESLIFEQLEDVFKVLRTKYGRSTYLDTVDLIEAMFKNR